MGMIRWEWEGNGKQESHSRTPLMLSRGFDRNETVASLGRSVIIPTHLTRAPLIT